MIFLRVFCILLIFPTVGFGFFGSPYEKALKKVMKRHCNGNRWHVGEETALMVAREVADGQLDLGAFTEAWDVSCDIDVSLALARDVAAGKASKRAFMDLVNLKCAYAYHVGAPEALEMAREAKANNLDVAAFSESWRNTCNFPVARQLGNRVAKGQADAGAFLEVVSTKCNFNRSVLDDETALLVASEVATKKIGLNSLLFTWKKTCNADLAIAAGREAAGYRPPAVTDKPSLEGEGSSEIAD